MELPRLDTVVMDAGRRRLEFKMSNRAWVRAPMCVFAVTLATTCFASGSSVAQPVAQSPYTHGHLAGFGGDPTALPRAIRNIERNGGRVMEIRFDSSLGHPGYDVVVERGDHVDFVRLAEPEAGLVVASTSAEPAWMLGWRGRRDVKIVQQADIGLAKAVRVAESQNGGAPAVAAGIAVSASNASNSVPAYNVLLEMPDSRVRRVAVDSRTGLVIADPQALSNWP